MTPPTPSTSSVAPIRSGATSCTLRLKNERFSGLPRRGAAASAGLGFRTILGENRSRNRRNSSLCCTIRQVSRAGSRSPPQAGCRRERHGLARYSRHFRTEHGRPRRYRLRQPGTPASPRKGEPAGCAVAAEAGLDPGARAEHPRLRRHPKNRQGKRPRHGVRGSRLPEYRRVLGQEARHLHDHGGHLHPRLRVLQRQDRHARRARRRRAGTCRGGHLQARAQPCRGHLGRSRRSGRRRRRAFRANHPRDPRALPGHDHRNPHARLPAQGRRAGGGRRGQARRVQPQSGNRAVALSDASGPARAISIRSGCCSGSRRSIRRSSPSPASWSASARSATRCCR